MANDLLVQKSNQKNGEFWELSIVEKELRPQLQSLNEPVQKRTRRNASTGWNHCKVCLAGYEIRQFGTNDSWLSGSTASIRLTQQRYI